MKWVLLITLFVTQSSYAKSIDNLAFLFYKNKINSSSNKSLKNVDQCENRPDSSSCAKVICSSLPPYKCDDTDEIKEVVNACKGNINGGCIQVVVSKLPPYKADDLDELKEIALQCKDVHGSGCINIYATHLPSYKIDDKDEIFSYLNVCKSASYDVVECATFTCSKLPSYKCDDADEISDIIKSCGN